MGFILAERGQGLLAEIFQRIDGKALDRHFHMQVRLLGQLQHGGLTHRADLLTGGDARPYGNVLGQLTVESLVNGVAIAAV